MGTIAARLEAATAHGGHVTFVGSGDERVPWAQLLEEARGVAAALQARGVAPGDRVALLGPTSRPLVTAIEAVWLCGAAVVVLPLPMRLGSLEDFVAQTRGRIRAAAARVVLVDPDLAAFVEPAPDDPPLVELGELGVDGGGAAWEPPPDDPDALAIVQFTSGATADPKGVMLPHRQVLANVDAMATVAGLTVGDDVLVSWLPLYHDMGLIGLLTLPATTGADLVLGAPQDFLAAPARWMEWVAAHGGTATAGPNFSYVLAARALRRSGPLDLGRLRIALNGAEPVDPPAVRDFVDAAAPHRLDPGAVFPAFGMAEATLGVTFPAPGSGLRTDPVERRVLETDRYAAPAEPGAPGTRELARLGRPLPGLEVRVVAPDTGVVRADREVGELEVRGASVTTGYLGRPEATADLFRDGWLRTGDLAYLADGELVVCGRQKDVIIVGGRNVFPEDVERAAHGVDGVRAGNVIAFGVEARRGREGVVVVAETRDADAGVLRRRVAERVRDAVGLGVDDVVLVQPGSLPKTSSGKLQRSLCRERYLAADLARA